MECIAGVHGQGSLKNSKRENFGGLAMRAPAVRPPPQPAWVSEAGRVVSTTEGDTCWCFRSSSRAVWEEQSSGKTSLLNLICTFLENVSITCFQYLLTIFYFHVTSPFSFSISVTSDLVFLQVHSTCICNH